MSSTVYPNTVVVAQLSDSYADVLEGNKCSVEITPGGWIKNVHVRDDKGEHELEELKVFEEPERLCFEVFDALFQYMCGGCDAFFGAGSLYEFKCPQGASVKATKCADEQTIQDRLEKHDLPCRTIDDDTCCTPVSQQQAT